MAIMSIVVCVHIRACLEDCTALHGVHVRGCGAAQALAVTPAVAVPDHVMASATFLGLVYPGRGLERSVRKEHLDNMTPADFIKVWKVSALCCAVLCCALLCCAVLLCQSAPVVALATAPVNARRSIVSQATEHTLPSQHVPPLCAGLREQADAPAAGCGQR
jgi:hypothetical protein